MKKSLTALLAALGLLLVALPAAAAFEPREASFEYTGTTYFAPPNVHAYVFTGDNSLATRRSERSVEVEIVERTGRDVSGLIHQYRRGEAVLTHEFCGSTERRVPIVPGRPIYVYVGGNACGPTGAVATNGTVVATFYP